MEVATVARFAALLAFLAAAGAIMVFAAVFVPAPAFRRLRAALAPVALPLAAAVAVTATAGSLYFSEVAHFVPCKFCWFHRIAMYPLALILTIAAVRRDRTVRRYALPLAAIGATVSTYHVQLERFPSQKTFCAVEVPCTIPPLNEFGFVTLAVMALCGFLAVTGLLLVARPHHDPSPTSTA